MSIDDCTSAVCLLLTVLWVVLSTQQKDSLLFPPVSLYVCLYLQQQDSQPDYGVYVQLSDVCVLHHCDHPSLQPRRWEILGSNEKTLLERSCAEPGNATVENFSGSNNAGGTQRWTIPALNQLAEGAAESTVPRRAFEALQKQNLLPRRVAYLLSRYAT